MVRKKGPKGVVKSEKGPRVMQPPKKPMNQRGVGKKKRGQGRDGK